MPWVDQLFGVFSLPPSMIFITVMCTWFFAIRTAFVRAVICIVLQFDIILYHKIVWIYVYLYETKINVYPRTLLTSVSACVYCPRIVPIGSMCIFEDFRKIWSWYEMSRHELKRVFVYVLRTMPACIHSSLWWKKKVTNTMIFGTHHQHRIS